MTTIDEYAFHRCNKLVAVSIGKSVTNIGNNAFSNCPITYVAYEGLVAQSYVTFDPETVKVHVTKNYQGDSFCGCPVEHHDVLFNHDSTTLLRCWTGYSGSYNIPDTVTGLTSVTIPNHVTHIGDSAFYGCSGLTSANLGCVEHIGKMAFIDCSLLKDVSYEGTRDPSWEDPVFDKSVCSVVYVPHEYSDETFCGLPVKKEEPEEDPKSPIGMIVGIVAGAVVIIAVVVILLVLHFNEQKSEVVEA